MKKKNAIICFFVLGACLTLSACSTNEPPIETQQNTIQENVTENKYHILFSKNTENDSTKYGNIKQEHEEFQNQDGSVYFYYDMECFYFDENYLLRF